MSEARAKLIEQQSKRWCNAPERVDKALLFVRYLYPEYDEHAQVYIASILLDEIAKRFDLEHGWNCVGEECRYWRVVLLDHAKRAGFQPTVGTGHADQS